MNITRKKVHGGKIVPSKENILHVFGFPPRHSTSKKSTTKKTTTTKKKSTTKKTNKNIWDNVPKEMGNQITSVSLEKMIKKELKLPSPKWKIPNPSNRSSKKSTKSDVWNVSKETGNVISSASFEKMIKEESPLQKIKRFYDTPSSVLSKYCTTTETCSEVLDTLADISLSSKMSAASKISAELMKSRTNLLRFQLFIFNYLVECKKLVKTKRNACQKTEMKHILREAKGVQKEDAVKFILMLIAKHKTTQKEKNALRLILTAFKMDSINETDED